MRKTTIRHIVHGILDLLPLFVIPIFAIYSRNENAQFGYEVTQEVNKAVDFNQLFDYEDYPTITFQGLTYTNNNNGSYTISGQNVSNSYYNIANINANNHYYIIKGCELGGSDSTYMIRMSDSFGNTIGYDTGNGAKVYNGNGLTIYMRILANYNPVDILMTPQIFDVTQMDLENLTIDEFNALFPSSFYPYTENQEVVIENYETITYNDTDIGSQMVYTLYNTIDKYFNMNNVFNMNQVYQWFEINIFGGTAPLAIYIVWNIVLYEFVMDLLMLLYALFMFFIDMCKKLMEKPLTSIK